MCVYCATGDWPWRHDPPWYPQPDPRLPPPAIWPQPQPYQPWDVAKLKEYLELLKQIKALEDQIGGCPCPEERDKPDHIKILQDRVDELQGKIAKVKEAVADCPCGKTDCKCGGNCQCQTTTISDTTSNPPFKVT